MGESLSYPQHPIVGAPPADLHAESVVIPSTETNHLAGWQVRGIPGAGAILLLHGVRSDHRQMTARARFLNRLGYSVVWVDLPAHGESTGDRITFGAREAQGVQAALAYMKRQLPDEALGIIGVSLGAAATVMAGPDRQVHAIVLESMYPTISDAVSNRLRIYLGPGGQALAPLLFWQFSWRLGVSPSALRPIDHVADLHAPVLIASGALDRRTPVLETQRIFDAALPEKELWIVEGAAHVDLHAFAPNLYEARVGNFLQRHLPIKPTQSWQNPSGAI